MEVEPPEERERMSPRHTPPPDRVPRPVERAGDRTPADSEPIPEPRARSPRPYHPPRLVAYGRLTDITRFGGSQTLDTGGNLGNLQ